MEKDNAELIAAYNNIRQQAVAIIQNGSQSDQATTQVYTSIKLLATAVAKAAIFSANENFSEIKTEHIRFITLPYFAGMMCSNVNGDRKSNLFKAKEEFSDFLSLLHHYEGIEKEQYKIAKELMDGKYNQGMSMEDQRNRTVSQYKLKKSIEAKIGVKF